MSRLRSLHAAALLSSLLLASACRSDRAFSPDTQSLQAPSRAWVLPNGEVAGPVGINRFLRPSSTPLLAKSPQPGEPNYEVVAVGLPSSTTNVFPFGGRFGSNPGTRYQQAYSSAEFSISGPIYITGLRFRGGSGTFVASQYAFHLSTVQSDVDALDATNLDNNAGSDRSLFAGVGLSGTAPATLSIAAAIPFRYNPGDGNLLLDIIASPGGQDWPDSPAAYASRTDAFGVFSRYQDYGDGITGYGLVTEFEYVVPTLENLIAVVDNAITAQTLEGTGSRAGALAHLKNWRSLLLSAAAHDGADRLNWVCKRLEQAYSTAEPTVSPADLVTGAASGVIIDMLVAVMSEVGCN